MKNRILLWFDWWKDQASSPDQYEFRLSLYKKVNKLLKRK